MSFWDEIGDGILGAGGPITTISIGTWIIGGCIAAVAMIFLLLMALK